MKMQKSIRRILAAIALSTPILVSAQLEQVLIGVYGMT